MHDLLKDPKKRRQLLIGGVAAGGVVLFLLLRKKSSGEAVSETGASPAVEQVPVESGGGSGSGGGNSGGGSSGGQESLAPLIQGLEQSQQSQTEAIVHAQAEQSAGFLAFLNGLSGGGTNSTEGGSSNGKPGAAGTPLSTANRLTNTQAGNPRNGEAFTVKPAPGGAWHVYPAQDGKAATRVFVPSHAKGRSPSQPPQVNKQAGSHRVGEVFTPGKYKGKPAHIYTHSVKGGVGPKHNIVIV